MWTVANWHSTALGNGTRRIVDRLTCNISKKHHWNPVQVACGVEGCGYRSFSMAQQHIVVSGGCISLTLTGGTVSVCSYPATRGAATTGSTFYQPYRRRNIVRHWQRCCRDGCVGCGRLPAGCVDWRDVSITTSTAETVTLDDLARLWCWQWLVGVN